MNKNHEIITAKKTKDKTKDKEKKEMNNNVIPTVYQAAWIESATKKYKGLRGQLKQMKQQIESMNQEARRREKEFARERSASAREGFLHGVGSVYPYTFETIYGGDEGKGSITVSKNQDAVADRLNELNIPPNILLNNNATSKEVTQQHVSMFLKNVTSRDFEFTSQKHGPGIGRITFSLPVDSNSAKFRKNVLFGTAQNK